MGIIGSFKDAISGSLGDQWLEIITAGVFSEHMVVAPGVLKNKNGDRGVNVNGSTGIISNGSKIFVPENTAAFIFSEGGIEQIITTPGPYQYENGEASIFNGDGIGQVAKQSLDRVRFGGISQHEKRISFVNLREIRNIKYGTKGPQIYFDSAYGVDLSLVSFGTISLKVIDAEKFIRNFVPANTPYYSFDDINVRTQLLGEFLQSYTKAINSLSAENVRVSQIISKVNEIEERVSQDTKNAGTWEERFGLKLTQIGIENIGLTDESKEMIRKYTANKMDVSAFNDISANAANIAAQQNVAGGIQENGLGNGGGMLFGMNMAQAMSNNGPGGNVLHQEAQEQNGTSNKMSLDEQMNALNQLKSLVDSGILTEEEFNIKKKEILGI